MPEISVDKLNYQIEAAVWANYRRAGEELKELQSKSKIRKTVKKHCKDAQRLIRRYKTEMSHSLQETVKKNYLQLYVEQLIEKGEELDLADVTKLAREIGANETYAAPAIRNELEMSSLSESYEVYDMCGSC